MLVAMSSILRFIVLFLAAAAPLPGAYPYLVSFEGVEEGALLQTIQSASQLERMQNRPPASLFALQKRIESDLKSIREALQTHGYYAPLIETAIDTEMTPPLVTLTIDTGEAFLFEEVTIDPFIEGIDPTCLGITPQAVAYPADILNAESRLVRELSWRGFPMNSVEREVVANHETHTVSVRFLITTGPSVTFGPTIIKGLGCVKPNFVCRKILWYQGDCYNPKDIDLTLASLEATGLFTSVTITPDTELNEEGELPLTLELIERKPRTIGFGASYNSQLGPGGMMEWEHRNIRGLGEKLSVQAELFTIKQRVTASFRQPDYISTNQDLLSIAEFEHENIDPFTEVYFSITNLVERRMSRYWLLSYGLQFKELDSTNSNNNRTFSLVKLPLSLRYNNSNHLLDSTRGQTLNLKVTPTWQMLKPTFLYYIQTLIGTAYVPLIGTDKLIFACKGTLGMIFGPADRTIPPPERFYSGTENTLRGYKYMTVSPLNAQNKPIGGRSMLIFSAELRSRFNDSFGGALFYEVGNVYKEMTPKLNLKQLQSAGFGLRYYTAVGPLRFDLAFPLNRRPGLDNSFEFYVSIGQAF